MPLVLTMEFFQKSLSNQEDFPLICLLCLGNRVSRLGFTVESRSALNPCSLGLVSWLCLAGNRMLSDVPRRIRGTTFSLASFGILLCGQTLYWYHGNSMLLPACQVLKTLLVLGFFFFCDRLSGNCLQSSSGSFGC